MTTNGADGAHGVHGVAAAHAARDALARLRRWGGEPLARSMATLFAEAVAERTGAMRAAVAAGDRGELASAAHSLKASCGQIGAAAAEGLSREIERVAHSADATTLGALVARVEAECRAHLAWLEGELAGAGRA